MVVVDVYRDTRKSKGNQSISSSLCACGTTPNATGAILVIKFVTFTGFWTREEEIRSSDRSMLSHKSIPTTRIQKSRQKQQIFNSQFSYSILLLF